MQDCVFKMSRDNFRQVLQGQSLFLCLHALFEMTGYSLWSALPGKRSPYPGMKLNK